MGNRVRELQGSFIRWVEGLSNGHKRVLWGLADLGVMLGSTVLAYYLFLDVVGLPLAYYWVFLPLAFVLYSFLSQLSKLGMRIKRYISLRDILVLFLVVVLASLASTGLTGLAFRSYSCRFASLVSLFSGAGIVGLRLVWQTLYRSRHVGPLPSSQAKENIVVIGAGDGGGLYMSYHRQIRTQQQVVAILDENPSKWGTNILGVTVRGDLDQLPALAETYQVKKAIIAIPSLSVADYERVLGACNQLGIRVFNMPKVEDILLGIRGGMQPAREIEIADLLGRKEVDLDEEALRAEIYGKTILITGAGGSIGSEIARQVAKLNPSQIILLGHGENSIYHIYHELLGTFTNMTQFIPVIADIKDADRMVEVMTQYQPDIVYHAAAHKHVPLMEANPQEAFKNNILGTYNIARAVDQTGVAKMVMVSTDKAIRPTNVMGASKRIAELIVTSFCQVSQSTYCVVRFGNVLGSRGSVIPAFQKMIEAGGPVKVTDFRMTRYFMTIPEASRLVIHAGAKARAGEVFILEMGESVRIVDLARQMILLSGYQVEDIGIVESGIRPGEKLYEELITSPDNISRQIDDSLFVSKVEEVALEDLEAYIQEMAGLIDQPDLLKKSLIDYANQSA